METFIKHSEDFIEGNVFIHTSVGYVDKENDYWNEKLGDKTYQIYVHSLTFLKYLSESYEKTKDEKYLSEAYKMLDKWLVIKHKSKFINHEQPVAARVNNILRYAKFKYPEKLPKKLTEIIESHITFLLDEKNYRKNNHGIMMDTSLSGTLKYMPVSLKHLEKLIIEKVMKRSKEAIDRDYSSNLLHLENSPDYHRLTVRWLKVIENNLNLVNSTIGADYVNKLEDASKLDGLVAMPNLRYPINGDSSDGSFKGVKNYEDFIDKEAGRAIFQNKKNKSQLTFISGYGRKGHKHYDDLSFIFFDGNQVLFNDSGKYNYNKNDKVRKHVISPLAHNSLSIYKENYVISNKKSDQDKIYIDNYLINEKYKIIKGINRSYPDTKLTRYIAILDNDTIIIYDKFVSKTQNTIAVNFNLGLNVKASQLGRGKYLIEGLENYVLQSHFGKYTSVILNDSDLTPCKISNRFNKYDSNQRILYRQKTRKGFFLTSISQENDEIELIEFNETKCILKCNNQTYSISFEI